MKATHIGPPTHASMRCRLCWKTAMHGGRAEHSQPLCLNNFKQSSTSKRISRREQLPPPCRKCSSVRLIPHLPNGKNRGFD
jgi:hypothetical protein